MTRQVSAKLQLQLAASLFNRTWELMEKEKRILLESEEMVHAAHASCYHWDLVGKPVNLARGEWQVSRAYSTVKRPEPALYHAKRSLKICQENNIGDFDLAFAYEALARACMIAGIGRDQVRHYKKALEASKNIKDSEDRLLLLKDLKTIKHSHRS